MNPGDYQRNTTAYRRLKDSLEQTFPRGWFVAIADEQVAGAAADLPGLESQLRDKGMDPRQTLVVEAGVEYPEQVTIFPLQ